MLVAALAGYQRTMEAYAVAIDGDIVHDPWLDPLEPDSEVCFLHRIEGG